MTDIDLSAIRARDAACAIEYAPDPASDRRALLAAYDALAAAARKVVWFDFCDDDDDVQEAVADLRALLGGE